MAHKDPEAVEKRIREMAEGFAALSNAEQAYFFEMLGGCVKSRFPGRPQGDRVEAFRKQMIAVAEELKIRSDGYDDTMPSEFALQIMRSIGHGAVA